MDVGTMRTLCRDILEVEAEDWPDPILDVSLAEGYERIIASEVRWPFLAARWSYLAPAGVVDHLLTDLGDVRDITSLSVGSVQLQFLGELEAEERYGSSVAGPPRAWSQWGDQVRFWPTPSTDTVIQIRGYRWPSVFSSLSGWEPDLPAEFHSMLCDWALGNEYQRQDDTEMMTAYRNKFEQQLSSLRGRYMAMPSAVPLVVGGDALGTRR